MTHADIPDSIARRSRRAPPCCRPARPASPCWRAPALVRAQAAPKIRIGYWPVAAGLPFYAAVEQRLLQGGRPRGRAAQVRRRAADDGSDAVGPLRRQRQRHRLGQPRHRRDRAAGPLQDLLHQPEQRQVRARRVHRRQGQPDQDDGRAQGQAGRLRPRHPERDAVQDDAGARRRHRRDRDRTADRPARRRAGRGPGRRLLHAGAHRHRRPHERHHARARGRRGRASTSWAIRWRRGTAARPASRPSSSRRTPRRRRSSSPPMRAASSWCAPSRTRRAST